MHLSTVFVFRGKEVCKVPFLVQFVEGKPFQYRTEVDGKEVVEDYQMMRSSDTLLRAQSYTTVIVLKKLS